MDGWQRVQGLSVSTCFHNVIDYIAKVSDRIHAMATYFYYKTYLIYVLTTIVFADPGGGR